MQPELAFINEIRLGVRLRELIDQTFEISLAGIYPSPEIAAEIDFLLTACKTGGDFYKPYLMVGLYVLWLTIKCRYFEGVMCN